MRALPTPGIWRWTLIFFLLMRLSGCSVDMGEPPFHIRKLSFSATPAVGKVTDLVIEVANDLDRDAALVRVGIYAPDGVHLVNTSTLKKDPANAKNYLLESALKAKEKATYRVPLCVTQEGDFRILVGAYDVLSESSVLGESETIKITNDGIINRVVNGLYFRFTLFPRGYRTPISLPAECSETK